MDEILDGIHLYIKDLELMNVESMFIALTPEKVDVVTFGSQFGKQFIASNDLVDLFMKLYCISHNITTGTSANKALHNDVIRPSIDSITNQPSMHSSVGGEVSEMSEIEFDEVVDLIFQPTSASEIDSDSKLTARPVIVLDRLNSKRSSTGFFKNRETLEDSSKSFDMDVKIKDEIPDDVDDMVESPDLDAYGRERASIGKRRKIELAKFVRNIRKKEQQKKLDGLKARQVSTLLQSRAEDALLFKDDVHDDDNDDYIGVAEDEYMDPQATSPCSMCQVEIDNLNSMVASLTAQLDGSTRKSDKKKVLSQSSTDVTDTNILKVKGAMFLGQNNMTPAQLIEIGKNFQLFLPYRSEQINETTVSEIKEKHDCLEPGHLAKWLLLETFALDELYGRNVGGKTFSSRGEKEILDIKKMEVIKEQIFRVYDHGSRRENEMMWRHCCNVINRAVRYLFEESLRLRPWLKLGLWQPIVEEDEDVSFDSINQVLSELPSIELNQDYSSSCNCSRYEVNGLKATVAAMETRLRKYGQIIPSQIQLFSEHPPVTDRNLLKVKAAEFFQGKATTPIAVKELGLAFESFLPYSNEEINESLVLKIQDQYEVRDAPTLAKWIFLECSDVGELYGKNATGRVYRPNQPQKGTFDRMKLEAIKGQVFLVYGSGSVKEDEKLWKRCLKVIHRSVRYLFNEGLMKKPWLKLGLWD